MVTLTDSTLRANVFETIYDLINAISFSLSSSNSVTVTAAFVEDEQVMPQVVVHPVDVDFDDFVFDRSYGMREIRVLVEIFSKKRKDLDQMTDAIMNALRTGSTPGMQLQGTTESTAMNAPAGLKIHSKALGFTYARMS